MRSIGKRIKTLLKKKDPRELPKSTKCGNCGSNKWSSSSIEFVNGKEVVVECNICTNNWKNRKQQ